MKNELSEKNYEHLENEVIEIVGYTNINCIKVKLIDYDIGIKIVDADNEKDDIICLSGKLSANKEASEKHSVFYDEYFKYIVDCFENETVCELKELHRLSMSNSNYYSSGMASCAF